MELPVRALSWFASISFVPAVQAQELVWRQVQSSSLSNCAMTFDTARSRFVVVSGSQTLEWDGAAWRPRETAHAAPARLDQMLAYDRVRRCTLMFGGQEQVGVSTVVMSGTLWQYDGNDWTQRAAGGPPGRVAHAMAFDSVRGRVVLFGGQSSADLGDTWEWDGNAWTHLTPSIAPQPRIYAAMAFHAATAQMILFGGNSLLTSPHSCNDTWAWNGTTWTALAPATIPQRRQGHRMSANDAAGTVVMHGGVDTSTGPVNDTWEWNGNNWVGGAAIAAPPFRASFGMATDAAGTTLMAGGIISSGPLIGTYQVTSFGDTWTYPGGGRPWVQVAPTGPPYRLTPVAEYDSVRDRVILAGGSIGVPHTWEWDGVNWTQRNPTLEWPLFSYAASAYDRNRGVMVVYGGLSTSGFPLPAALTYEWNGSTWSQINVTGPPARFYHGMTYDRARGVTVMYGGQIVGGVFGDTWTWNGAAWTLVASTGPPARSSPGMAYDVARARVVLFGGMQSQLPGIPLLGDTWEWDGATWNQASPPVSPSPRCAAACAYDPRRSRVVALGGIAQVSATEQRAVREAWEWDGVTWTGGPRDVPVDPLCAEAGALVYHDRLQRLLLVTSPCGNGGLSNDLWIGAPEVASAVVAGTGCGSAVPPTLNPFEQPAIGNTRFAIDLLGVPPNAFALLGASTGSGTVALGSGCTFYLQGSAVTVAATANAAGFASIRIPVPASAGLIGLDVIWQAAATDSAAPMGIDLTPLVHGRVGI
jgi:hypothetical protein